MYRFFTENDFFTASPKCSMSDMDSDFLSRLDTARDIAKVPFIVNSAYRTIEHEKKQGRNGLSSHTKGLAVDLKATNPRTRFRILKGLIQSGFTRIGIYKTHIHCDFDTEKEQDVTWL